MRKTKNISLKKEISKKMSDKIIEFVNSKISDRIDFYSDSNNYLDSGMSPDDRYTCTPILEDKGSRALECKKLLDFLANWDKYSLTEKDHDLLDSFIENEDREFSNLLYEAWWN